MVLSSDGCSNGGTRADTPSVDFLKSILVVEFSDMLRRNNMLGSNRFSPLSDLDSDSNVDEVLMLNWDNSFLTGKGNETRNFFGFCASCFVGSEMWVGF